ncbi:MAG TPA: hypothetical protein VMS22_16750 [Candidatus Eisenbacteria bacterium]|nr:hypothetical protein [Candidatus Eisenbacteria bacterium]
MGAGERTVLVLDTDSAWERIGLASHRVACVPPSEAARVDAHDAAAVVANLSAPCVLDAIARWPARAAPPLAACVTVPGAEQVVSLRGVAVVAALRPADPIAALVRRRQRRSPRVVAAGPSPGALLGLRRVLANDGAGVSLAWDAVQARDLCDLVHPHVVVLDLTLPRGAHDLVVSLGLERWVPDLVLVPGRNDAFAFAVAFVHEQRRSRLPSRADALAALVAPAAPPGLRAHRAHG